MKRLIALILLIPVLCYAAPTYYYVNATGGGTVDGSSWANAFNYTEWEKSVEAIPTGGATNDTYYFVKGNQTYTLTSDFLTAGDGIATLPNYIIGVKNETTAEPPTSSDYANGNERPVITDSTNAFTFTFDDYWIIKNLNITGSDTDTLRADEGSVVVNCYLYNDGSATRYAMQAGGRHTIINNEIISTNGIASSVVGGSFAYNYVHNSVTGIAGAGSDNCLFVGNIFDTLTVAIDFGNTALNNYVISNTFYQGGNNAAGSIAIDTGTGSYNWLILHNIITDFETGINFGDASYNTGYSDYNDIYDCTTDRVAGMSAGPNDQDTDPQFVDAANGDFDIGANLDDDGLDQPGDNSTSHLEIGGVMYEETAGGGGGGCSDVFGLVE